MSQLTGLDRPVCKYNNSLLPKRAAYGRKGHPSRAGSVWLEAGLSSALLTRFIYGLRTDQSHHKIHGRNDNDNDDEDDDENVLPLTGAHHLERATTHVHVTAFS